MSSPNRLRSSSLHPLDNDEELVVVWSGADELLPSRETKPDLTWEPPRRLYNRKQKVTITVDARTSVLVEKK